MTEPMKYLFFGSPRFAEIILKRLIESGYPPIAVVTNPDRPVGRKKVLTAPAVKVLAEKHGIAVLQPESLEMRNCLPAEALAQAGKLEIS